jgi:histidine triad (HIT) family protein
MDECDFCWIVGDHSRSEILWDDEMVLAFMDINPVTDGHCLVIPKAHSIGIDDMEAAKAARMMNVAQRLAAALKQSDLRCEGVNLFFADGEAAFQEVFHSHLHVFPRFVGDGFKISADWKDQARQTRIGATADEIRATL